MDAIVARQDNHHKTLQTERLRRGGVRHNGDGEKNGDANQVERNVSAVTEG